MRLNGGLPGGLISQRNLRRIAPPPVDPYQAITPGAGWSGATTVPGPVGDPGAIAFYKTSEGRWGCPQYDTITGELVVWLYCGHVPTSADYVLGFWHGMDYVDFSVNDGPIVTVTSPQLNPNNGCYGWPVKIREADFGTGEDWEMRATLYPRNGTPRVLQGAAAKGERSSLWFHTGAKAGAGSAYVSATGNDTTGDGTLGNPYATVKRAIAARATANSGDPGGSTIYCGAGSHVIGSDTYTAAYANKHYVTIARKADAAAADVLISYDDATNRTGCDRIRIKEVRTTQQLRVGGLDFIWFDHCPHDPGAEYHQVSDTGPNQFGFTGGIYFTGGSATNCDFGPWNADLVENYTVIDISSDSYTNCRLILNSGALKITGGEAEDSPGVGTGDFYHPDFLQMFASGGTFDGGIYYKMTGNSTPDMSAQGPFPGVSVLCKNLFFWEIDFDNSPSTRWSILFGGCPLEHVMLHACNLLGSAGLAQWGDADFDVVVSAGSTYANPILPAKVIQYPIPEMFDFTAGALPSGATLTRGDTAWYHDAADNNLIKSVTGNTARFQGGGLLYEPARTNIWTTNASAGTGLSAEVQTGLSYATDGFLMAAPADRFYAKITINSSASAHWDRFLGKTPAGDTVYEASVYLIDVTAGRCQIAIPNEHASAASQTYVNVNLATGAVLASGSGVSGVNVEDWGGGNYRVSFLYTTKTTPTSTTPLYIAFINSDTAGYLPSYTGNGTDALIWYAAQVAPGGFVTSWAGGGGTDETRAAEVLTLNWGLLGIADGTHDVVYTFDDDTTQLVSTAISGGNATVPTNLNRRIIKAAQVIS